MIKFRLIKTVARNFCLSIAEDGNVANEGGKVHIENMDTAVHISNEDNQGFAISFDLKAYVGFDETLKIDLEYWAFFEADRKLTKKFLNGPFTRINAPAIAFPYLRGFVTNVLVSAGYPAVYLPTINFVALDEKNNRDLEK